MKREIVCLDCEKDLKELFPYESPFPGEHVRFINGKAKRQFYCDQCLALIPQEETCCAFSIYSDSRPYYNWEDGYIKIDDE